MCAYIILTILVQVELGVCMYALLLLQKNNRILLFYF